LDLHATGGIEMDWWLVYLIVFGILSVPWLIKCLTDGMFILNQIFRFLFWGSFLICYELIDLHWFYCLLLAQIPGTIVWGCYDHWFNEGNDDPEKPDDEFENGTPVEEITKSNSLIVWQVPETSI
jgi:hypothetical protein